MTFSRLQCVEFLAPATQNALHVRKRARHRHESFVPEARRRGHHFMRACAVEMDMRNSKSNFCASRPTQHAAPTRANPDLNPLNSYRKNPLVRSTIWGNNMYGFQGPPTGQPGHTLFYKSISPGFRPICMNRQWLIASASHVGQRNYWASCHWDAASGDESGLVKAPIQTMSQEA